MNQEVDSTSAESQPTTSPTLLRLVPEKLPNPSTVCQACPAAVWIVQNPLLRCYCRVMHLESWSSESPAPIQACDGQVMAEIEQERTQGRE